MLWEDRWYSRLKSLPQDPQAKEGKTTRSEARVKSGTAESGVTGKTSERHPIDLASRKRLVGEGFWYQSTWPDESDRTVKALGSPVELACHHPAMMGQ